MAASKMLASLTAFFGWCTVLQLIVLAVSAFILLWQKSPVARIHARFFGVQETDLPGIYFVWLGNFKLFCVVFFMIPWCALKIIA